MASVFESSTFDLIVLGTGLPQCMVAAATATSGHSVLQLDDCGFYGSHWASLPLKDFSDWCSSSGQLPFPSPSSRLHPLDSVDHHYHGNVERAADGCSDSSGEVAENEVPLKQEETQGTDTGFNQSGDTLKVGTHNESSSKEVSQNQDNGFKEESELNEAKGMYSKGTPKPSGPDSCLILQAEDHRVDSECPIFYADSMAEMGLEAVFIRPGASEYSNFHFINDNVEVNGPSRGYNLDLAGPKLAFCSGPLVDVLLRSKASNYVQFKDTEASFIWTVEGLSPVPASRADVFKDRTLSNTEKRHLMRFFRLVLDHASSMPEASPISEVDMESPFVEFLQRKQLPSSVESMILYAIALSSYEQDSRESGGRPIMSTREGLQNLALYLNSIGRFENASGAFLYPSYGQGELPQAFSRCAAVKGAIQALRMPVEAFLKDKKSHEFRGILISTTNQLIFGKKLVTGPSLYSTLSKGFFFGTNIENAAECHNLENHERKVARGVCITDRSLKPDLSTTLVVFPPHSVTQKESGVIRALQLGSSASVCPEGKFVVQLSMACSDGGVGIDALQAATRSLFLLEDSNSPGAVVDNGPTLLWAVFYVHDCVFPYGAKWLAPGRIAAFGMPDETVNYQSVVACAEKVFKGLYPEDTFFPGSGSLVTYGSGEEVI